MTKQRTTQTVLPMAASQAAYVCTQLIAAADGGGKGRHFG